MKSISKTSTLLMVLFLSSCIQDYTTASLNSNTANSLAATSPSISAPIALAVSSSTVAPNGQITLTGSGGTPPYRYSLASGVGSMTGSVYTATNAAVGNTAVVQVFDSSSPSLSTSATITVTQSGGITPLQISPTALYLYEGESISFSATGGSGSYNYAIISGSGSISGATYTAPASTTVAQVKVTDTNGLTSSTTITVTGPKAPLMQGVNVGVYSDLFVAFNMPNAPSASLNPSLIFGESSSTGCMGYGIDATCTSNLFDTTASTGYGPASAAIAISNYNPSDSSPYTGQLTISIQGSPFNPIHFNFCVSNQSNAASLASTTTPVSPVAMSQSASLIGFTALIANVASGTAFQELRIANLSANTLQTVAIEFNNGFHDHTIANCNNVTGYSLDSSSSQ